MKLYSILLSAALVSGAGLGVTSCNDDDYNQTIVFESDGFVVGKSAMALAGTTPGNFAVMAPSQPTVTSDAAWLHVNNVAKAGQGKVYNVEISADANTAYEPRTATITVTCGGQTKTVAVTQYGAETVELVSVTPSATLEPTGGNVTITYAATGDVEVSAPSWLLPKSKALVENELVYTYAGNFTEADRAGDVVITLVSDPSKTITVTLTQPKSEGSEMTKTAKQIVSEMYAGVNIGNTLEATGGEGAWNVGNQKVNLEYIRGLKAMGFNAVRVPCSWDQYATDNVIDAKWLDRVDEVIGYIVSEDMYAVLNIHWDGGWLEESCVKGYDKAIDEKQRAYWTQIAEKLNHYDEHLLFAGMNEPGYQDQAGVANNSIDAIMAYQKTFQDAVRATGGNNATRCLVHQAPYTNIDKAVAGYYHLPEDVVPDRQIVEVHFYDPSDFSIMDEDGQWSSKVKLYWGDNMVSGSDRNATWMKDAASVNSQIAKMKAYYTDKGIPGILGEYSTSIRTSSKFPEIDDAKHQASRADWNEAVTTAAKNAGLAPFYWETGGDINRRNGAATNQYAIDGLMRGAEAGNYPF